MAEPAAAGARRVRMSAAEREQQLLDVAEVLFTERGYEGVSVDEIARVAGVTRPIVYQHHGSKEGIFLACVYRARAQFEQSLVAGVTEVVEAGRNLRAIAAAGGAPYFDLIVSNPQRWALLFTTSANLEGTLAEQLGQLRHSTIVQVGQLVRPLVGVVGEDDLMAFSYAASGIAEQLGRWWLRNPQIPRERVLALYADLVVGAASLLQSPVIARSGN
ncbi:TetR/AcrR family transcriptional regulator [Nocardia sp. NBC_00403]|uniref:TetR/AcrR family transcriptional regulator n=1 Tax=Nocardia sp. NBC_00403 TaxID=2975990 RepID=UPI002E240408